MSSLDQQETVAAAVQNGAEEYLVKPVTRKEVQHIWQHVWRKRCAAAPVPQLPQEAAAAMAAATAVVAASEQHASQQQQQQQDVQQPATASLQQGAQQLALPQPGTCVVALIRSSPQAFAAGPAASLQQRQAVFFRGGCHGAGSTPAAARAAVPSPLAPAVLATPRPQHDAPAAPAQQRWTSCTPAQRKLPGRRAARATCSAWACSS